MKDSFYAGFDLGGTQLKFGLVDEEGNVVFKDKAATPSSIEELLELLRILWSELKIKGENRVSAAGFGFAGFYSLKEKKILHSPNYPTLDNFDLLPAIAKIIEVPFWVDNDANMAAFGEWKCGAGKGVSSLILLTIGTGIGSGIILDGKLWHGKCGFAGELGHITVNYQGERCKCGNQGCLETEASAPKIVKNYLTLRKKKEEITAEEIFHRARNGDELAKKSFAQAGFFLGIGLGIVINLLNPEKIILGGGVMEGPDFLLPAALKEAKKRSFRGSFECCFIERASLGNDAGLIGAAMWAKENFSPIF